MKKVTMQDIADKLNISKMTVSKAFKGKSDISKETKEKIVKAAIELGYVYNKSKPINILVITSEKFFMRNEDFYTGLYKRLNEVSSMRGYLLSLSIFKKDDEDTTLNNYLYQNFDAIIILGQLKRDAILKIKALNKPMVLLDFYYRDIYIDSVYSDNYTGSYEITSYLIDKGHKKIGFVGTLNSTSSINDRYFGYYKALVENNIPYNDKYIFSDRTDDFELKEIELNSDMPTAFVCNNDHVAYMLINKLKKLGYNVPKDIAVTGFDDDFYSTLSDPQITTMRVPRKFLAETSLDILKRRIDDPDSSIKNLKVECQLVERFSA